MGQQYHPVRRSYQLQGVPDSDKIAAARISFTAWRFAGYPFDAQPAAAWRPDPEQKVISSGAY
jgi:hypothetical protein